MQFLGNSLTRDEVQKHLVRTEKTITALEGELIALPFGLTRCRAFLHKELHEAYTVADALRMYEPTEVGNYMRGTLRGAGGAS